MQNIWKNLNQINGQNSGYNKMNVVYQVEENIMDGGMKNCEFTIEIIQKIEK